MTIWRFYFFLPFILLSNGVLEKIFLFFVWVCTEYNEIDLNSFIFFPLYI
jgi:hypothetical protein